jgi:ornithine lipid ester-linked acyl 2-hydroxylase
VKFGSEKRLRRKLVDILTLLLFVALRPVQRWMHRFSRIGDSEFFDPRCFAWVGELEKNWLQIRHELDRVLPYTRDIPNFQDLSEENRAITDDDRWKTFFFYAWGVRLQSNCERCPATAALLGRIDGMKSAFYSIMLPHKYLPPHRGPYAGVLRYHLGLIVPDVQRCRIRVGNQIGHWQEGRSLIFDDTFEHEVWNDSDGVRVVLFVDIARPLPSALALVNETVMRLIARSSLVRPALERFAEWDRGFATVWREPPPA